MILLIATENAHKAGEIAAILPDIGLEYLTLQTLPGYVAPPENGSTLRDNALIKARAACRASGLWTLADDTGLEVDFLGGRPGIYSARYAGEERDYQANNEKLMLALSGVPESARTARFRCVMALCGPQGDEIVEEGVLEGHIADTPRGTNGFGYDPLFVVRGTDKTLAEFSADEKNSVSHRYNAIKNIEDSLRLLAEDKL